jgi:hypothetical protein
MLTRIIYTVIDVTLVVKHVQDYMRLIVSLVWIDSH